MKLSKYITVILCSAFVLFFSLWCFFFETPDFSSSERRKLASFPDFQWERVASGTFAKEFEEYATDRFPLRDAFRRIKAYARLYPLMQQENNGLYRKDGHISKIEYPMEGKMLDYAADLFSKVYKENFPENKVYFAVVPDKNEYLSDLTIPAEEVKEYMAEKMPFCTTVSLGDLLSAEDYYLTDSHWRQEKIVPVAERILGSMGIDLNREYTKQVFTEDFYGVYYGQWSLPGKPDTIFYLTNEVMDGFQVSGAKSLYDEEKGSGKDPYEFFLSGNQPLVTIKNPAKTDGGRLIIFRDSYASSLAPLLAQEYSEVVLVDLRYINSAVLGEFVDFTGADILFLYSATLLNNSTAMK